MKANEKALIQKDIQEIVKAKRVLLPAIIIPVIFAVITPITILIIAHFVKNDPAAYEKMGPILKKMPEYKQYDPSQMIIKMMLDFMFPGYFIMIPIMCSGVIGASSFVGEREHKTMESLLYTPINMEQLLRCKILGVFIPTYILTVISFIFMAVIFNVGGIIYFDKIIFPDSKWILILLWVTPIISFLSLTFTAIVSAKSKSFQEAQQFSGILIIPVAMLIVVQMAGALMFSNLLVFIAGLLLLVLDFILLRKVSEKFIPEELV